MLDLFLGPGMPWPPRSNTDDRPSRLEYTRGALPFIEDAATRPYTIEPAPRSALDAYRDRDTLYGARYALAAVAVSMELLQRRAVYRCVFVSLMVYRSQADVSMCKC